MKPLPARNLIILALVSIATGGALWWRAQPPKLDHAVDVVMPALAGTAAEGAALFAENCQACHGENASGGEGGPPLIHKIYEPSHHADGAFYNAVLNGVRAHHWPFGNMPPVEGVTKGDVGKIIVFVRTVQRANGI